MEVCPTCGARLHDNPVCRRCRTDLGQVRKIERLAVAMQRRSLAALDAGRTKEAHLHARRAAELHRSPDSIKVLAVACLASRKFSAAVSLWREFSRAINPQEQIDTPPPL